MVVIDLFRAIKAGKELKNASTWSNVSSLTNVCVVILTFAVGAARYLGLDIPLTDDQLVSVGGSIAILMSVVNSVLHLATTKGAGL